MKRRITVHLKAVTTLALACATVLVFAVATVQARPTNTASSQAATAALSDCKIVITGAPWRILGPTRSGDKYTLKARDISCSSVRARVVAFTHQPGREFGAFKGPTGFKCTSFSTAASGDKLLYSGACLKRPHNDPFFEWGPKVPGH